ncbi:MAG: hypothetical protein ACYCRH_08110 [Acidiferrobacteraceae bacterium]
MSKTKDGFVSISICRAVLEAIYDECDRYDADETGGRLIGTFRKRGSEYEIDVSGMLGPGPGARRTATSFFQDGVYQERMFRVIEAQHPDIEHLGNWHTHHVNGCPTLSGGDEATYFNIVNHHNHNTDFFYALLVVKKNCGGDPRYNIKHFFLRRDERIIYEVPDSAVQILDKPALAIVDGSVDFAEQQSSQPELMGNLERVKDQEFFAEFYRDLRAMASKATGAAYWKGPVELADGSRVTVVAAEGDDKERPTYEIAAAGQGIALDGIKARFKNRRFPSARHAVIELERELNRALFRSEKGG